MTMKSAAVKIFVVFAIAAVCFSSVLTPPDQLSKGVPFTFADVPSDESAVYSTVIEKLILADYNDIDTLVLWRRPSFRSFRSPDQNTMGFYHRLDLPVNYIYVNIDDYDTRVLIEQDPDQSGKLKFGHLLAKYPNSTHLPISLVRFNEDRSEANVQYGSLSHGAKVQLKKEAGFWKIGRVSDDDPFLD